MKKTLSIQFLIVLTLLFSACAQSPSLPPSLAPTQTHLLSQALGQPTAIFTNMPDPCVPENLTAEVKKVNDLMRAFDDASAVASSTPKDNLDGAISELQLIRRLAEDQQVPTCLTTLKKYQLDHMNIVIETMLAFLNSSDQAVINDGINRARAAHDFYSLEVARLLGLTLVPITATVMLPVETSTPGPTVTPTP